MPAYVDTGLNLVHVDDCALGHLLAFKNGEVGERYILGGENLTLHKILLVLGNITGKPVTKVKIPHKLLVPLAYTSEIFARVVNLEPRLTLDTLHMSEKRMYFSSDKAKTELGYKSRSTEEALRDAVQWFNNNQYFKDRLEIG
jgi:dihydroflavonol-4-reductase